MPSSGVEPEPPGRPPGGSGEPDLLVVTDGAQGETHPLGHLADLVHPVLHEAAPSLL